MNPQELLDMTIVIPTKNRPHYIERILTYYLSLNFIGNIVIIDSSDEEVAQHIEKYVNDIDKENYTYTFSLGLPTTVIKENLNLIKTKYASLLGDDDYIIPNALLKAITFLENNEGIAGCRGDGILVTDSEVSSDDIRMYSRVSRLEEKSADRVLQHFLNYGTPFFHVLRSELFKKAFSLAPSETELTQDYDRLIGEELSASGLMLAYGKFAMMAGRPLFLFNFVISRESASASTTKSRLGLPYFLY